MNVGIHSKIICNCLDAWCDGYLIHYIICGCPRCEASLSLDVANHMDELPVWYCAGLYIPRPAVHMVYVVRIVKMILGQHKIRSVTSI